MKGSMCCELTDGATAVVKFVRALIFKACNNALREISVLNLHSKALAVVLVSKKVILTDYQRKKRKQVERLKQNDMWRIFIESGDWIMVALYILIGVLSLILWRNYRKTSDSGAWAFSIFFGVGFGIMTIAMGFMVNQYVRDYGREYTMVVDVYYPNNKVVRKTFTATNESILISYPYRSRMSTEIYSRTKKYLETTADVEIVSYTYKDKD